MKTNHKQNAVKLTASLAFTSNASKSAKTQQFLFHRERKYNNQNISFFLFLRLRLRTVCAVTSANEILLRHNTSRKLAQGCLPHAAG